MFGIMSRVNKVIIGVDSVMANGGLRTFNGCHAVSLAAAHYSVPVILHDLNNTIFFTKC
jgi:translation initiation factor eIF-2B subunit beta